MALKFVYTDLDEVVVSNERSMAFSSHASLANMVNGKIIKAGFIDYVGKGFGFSRGLLVDNGNFDLNDHLDKMRYYVIKNDEAVMISGDFPSSISYLNAIELATPKEIIDVIGIDAYLSRFK